MPWIRRVILLKVIKLITLDMFTYSLWYYSERVAYINLTTPNNLCLKTNASIDKFAKVKVPYCQQNDNVMKHKFFTNLVIFQKRSVILMMLNTTALRQCQVFWYMLSNLQWSSSLLFFLVSSQALACVVARAYHIILSLCFQWQKVEKQEYFINKSYFHFLKCC